MATTNEVNLKIHLQSQLNGITVDAEVNSQVNHIKEDLRAVRAAIYASFEDLLTEEGETTE